MLVYYMLFIAFSIFISLYDYRIGIYLMLIVGLLADPIRKLTPGNPVYISVAFGVIFCVIYFVLFFLRKKKIGIFYYFPKFRKPLLLFLLFLFLNAIRPLIVDFVFLPAVIYSLMQYIGVILAVQVGFYFINEEKDVVKFAKTYILILLPFLFTVLLHFMGFQEKWPILQTMEFGDKAYMRWIDSDTGVVMLNGIFRNPEPMGWHAMFGVICALFLIFRVRRHIFWKTYAIFFYLFGTFCVVVSGRRKFIGELLVFIVLFLAINMRKNLKRMILYLLTFTTLLGLGWYYIHRIRKIDNYIYMAAESFKTSRHEAIRRTVGSVIWAIRRDGFFGRGLGTTSQGLLRHVRISSRVNIDRFLIETGIGKLISELGVPGLLAFILLILIYFYNFYRIIKMRWFKGPSSITAIFLFSVALTNVIGFGISHQTYADPLIGMLLGFTLGFVLSVPKMNKYFNI